VVQTVLEQQADEPPRQLGTAGASGEDALNEERRTVMRQS
jgi:hypothetical protein